MATENNCDNSFGLKGVVDVLLIDKATHKIEKCIRKTNHITEPFARWLMVGQLSMFNPTGQYGTNGLNSYDDDRERWVQTNPIGQLLGAAPTETYQVVQGSCGSRSYGIYVLGEPITIDYTTQIPPYLNASLNAMSDKKKSDFRTLGLDSEGEQEIDSPLVIYYGTSTTSNDGSYTMGIDNSNSRWGMPLRNPAFTATFVKNAGTAYIRSVVLGATHGQLTVAEGQPAIIVSQSSPVVQEGWDNVWQCATYQTDSSNRSVPTKIGEDKAQAVYLFCPFGRVSMSNGRWGDGIYTYNNTTTSGQIGQYISYFDFATKQFENNESNTGNRQNTITGDYYSTNASTISNSIRQGIVIGTANGSTKAIRVNSTGSTAEAIKVNIAYQASLQDGTASSVTIATLTPEGACPDTLFTNCHPVMVPIRGDEASDDVVEIFVSTAVGEFTADATGVGGIGVAIHKFSVAIDAFRSSGSEDDLTAHVTDHGRVAVLPWAIGQCNAPTSGTSTDVPYVTGAYTDGLYYLPFTHLLRGCSPHNWSYTDDTSANSRELIMCSTANYLPGMVCDASTFTRFRDFVFCNESYARTMTTTDEGFVPLTLNRLHRWTTTMGSVISGVTFDEPIKKKDNQILVIRYTYTFDIVPAAPSSPVFTATTPTTTPTVSTINLNWENQSTVLSYRLQRTTDVFTNLTSIVALHPPVPTEAATTTLVDTGLNPNTMYHYRLCGRNNGGESNWATASLETAALTEQVTAPTAGTADASTVTTITPRWSWTDAIASLYFDKFEVQYKTQSEMEWSDVATTTALRSPTTTGIAITGLAENTEYLVQVRATVPAAYYEQADEANAVSDWSASMTISTTAYPLPVMPTDVSLVVQTYNEATNTSQGNCTWTTSDDMKYQATIQSSTESVATTVEAANTTGTIALPSITDTINLVTVTAWNDGATNGVDGANAKSAVIPYIAPKRFVYNSSGTQTTSAYGTDDEYYTVTRDIEWASIANAFDTDPNTSAVVTFTYSSYIGQDMYSIMEAKVTIFGSGTIDSYNTSVPLDYWNTTFDTSWADTQSFANGVYIYCILYGMNNSSTEVELDRFAIPFGSNATASKTDTTLRHLVTTANYPAYCIKWRLAGSTTDTSFTWPINSYSGNGATNTLNIQSLQLFSNPTINNAVQLSGATDNEKTITGTANDPVIIGTVSIADVTFSNKIKYSIVSQLSGGTNVTLFEMDGDQLKMPVCIAGTYSVDVQADGFGTHQSFTILVNA